MGSAPTGTNTFSAVNDSATNEPIVRNHRKAMRRTAAASHVMNSRPLPCIRPPLVLPGQSRRDDGTRVRRACYRPGDRECGSGPDRQWNNRSVADNYLIAIATYRRPAGLQRLLDSLEVAISSANLNVDIVVVDNDAGGIGTFGSSHTSGWHDVCRRARAGYLGRPQPRARSFHRPVPRDHLRRRRRVGAARLAGRPDDLRHPDTR